MKFIKSLLVSLSFAVLAAVSASPVEAQTFPVNNINIQGQLQLNGSPGTAGYVVQSNGTSPATWVPQGTVPTNGLTLPQINQIGANTVLGNATGSTANVTAVPVPGCSTASSAITYANATGWGCNTAIAASTANTATTAGNVTGIVGVANGGTGTTTPSLTAGSNIGVSGSWPNQTISAQALPVYDVQNVYAGNVANAAAAANTAGGGILYFAANTTFTVSSAIALGANVSVFCAPGSIIQTSSATADIFDQAGTNTFNQGCTYNTTVPRTSGIYVNMTGTEVVLKDFAMNNAYNGFNIQGTTALVEHGFINSSVANSMVCSLAGDAHIYGVTSNNGFNVSGYISGTTLTVTTAAPYNKLGTGQYIAASGVTGGTEITALGTGTGGTGTYTVSISQTAGSSSSPLTLNASGTGTGLTLTGSGGSAGCAVTLEGSGILLGVNSIAAVPPSGGTVFLFAVNDYLDNAAGNALLVEPASGGSVGYVRVMNSELGINSVNTSAVALNPLTGSTMGVLELTGNTIYSYQTNSGNGITLEGAVNPASVLITGNDIGVFGSPFAGGVSLNYSGTSSNAVITGNSMKGSTAGFFLGNTSDVSCLFAENKLNGSTKTTTGCNQNNNY
jgi:hypothetical protein